MSIELATPRAAPEARADLWGQPRQLWMLLTVTIGFNFAFYGFRAYLAPYIAGLFAARGAAAAQREADLLASGFLALMYATPIIGGYIADKFLGEARALAISLWGNVLGLALMALPSLPGFEMGLAMYALSTGLGIPLTVMIGRNYARDDPRREGGYTLFYMAINLGAFIAPFICADLIGRRVGYRWGFIACAVAVAMTAVLFELRQSRLRPVLPAVDAGRSLRASFWVLGATAVLLYPTAVLLSHPQVLSVTMYVLMGLLVLYFVVSCMRRGDRVQSRRYLALLLLFVALVLFWAFSFQGVTSLNFFARDHVRAPFDYTLLQSANPLFILIFAPLLAMLWPWLARRGRDPSTPLKFAIGLLLVALSYGLVAVAIRHGAGADARVSWGVLAGCYLLQTLGELALSPIGYSLVGLLAAPEEASLAMGGWFFGAALAYQLAGWIATLTIGAGGGEQVGLAGYEHTYGQLLWIGLAAGAAYVVAAPAIRRLMHGVH